MPQYLQDAKHILLTFDAPSDASRVRKIFEATPFFGCFAIVEDVSLMVVLAVVGLRNGVVCGITVIMMLICQCLQR